MILTHVYTHKAIAMKALVPLAKPPCLSSPPPPNPYPQETGNLLSVTVICFYFLEFYINGTIQCVFSRSGFFHSAFVFRDLFMLFVSILHSLLLLGSIPLCGYVTICLSGHLLMAIWVVSGFGLSQINLLRATDVLLFLPHTLVNEMVISPHFTDEKTENQRGQVTCPRSHSQ